MSHEDKHRLPLSNEVPAGNGRSVRDKVIRRFKKLAPVAVIAAAPVLNTACDPAPQPYCTQNDPSEWVANVKAEAVWIDGGGGVLEVQLTLTSSDQYALLAAEGYTAKGGTIDSTTFQNDGYVLVVTLDAAATELTVSGELNCDGYPGPYDVKLAWSGTPKAGDKLTATVTSTSK